MTASLGTQALAAINRDRLATLLELHVHPLNGSVLLDAKPE